MACLDDLSVQHSFLELGNDFYSRVSPSPLRDAYLIHGNARVASLIGLDAHCFSHPTFVPCFNGQQPHPQFAPLAMVYAGHQFGSYVPRLGDGRAMLLGEVKSDQGHWDLVTKGSGLTPYSRFADGRAVLRSSIREYLASAAMVGLGIPTSQALCLIGSEEPIQRERIEPGALIVRVAQSHIRFGSFEYLSHTQQHEALKTLVDYTIQRHFPELQSNKHPIEDFFHEVVKRTAKLMAAWQAVGFTHGVMNTDNMSIIGDTFDYGPFAFMDGFQSHFIPNHSDQGGRYAFDQQPGIALWNCRALAYALRPVLKEEASQEAIDDFTPTYHQAYMERMAAKLGLPATADPLGPLISSLIPLLSADEVDYTLFFRQLCDFPAQEKELLCLFQYPDGIRNWLADYSTALEQNTSSPEERGAAMKQANPKYILRSYMAEQAIRQAEDFRDHKVIADLMEILHSPFEEHPEFQHYANTPPDWSRDLELSCSS